MQLDALTGLRFFAAFYVVLYHGQAYFGWAPPLHTFLSHGFVSVPLFFVLSGFILSYTYLGASRAQKFDRRSFWINRLARIYPVYLLALLIATPFFFYGLWQEHNPVLLSAIKAVGSMLAVTTMTQAWIPTAATLWNVPAWSLSNEAFFYLVFPFVALAMARWQRRRIVVGATIIWLISLAAPLFYFLAAEADPDVRNSIFWGNLATYDPLLRLPEFLVGIALGLLFLDDARRSKAVPGRWLATGAGLILLLVLAMPGIAGVVYLNGGLVPLFALVVYGLAHAGRGRLPVLTHPAFIALGEASYAMYILQQPIWNVLAFLSKRVTHSDQLHLTHPLFFAIYVAALIGASLLTVRLLEAPARQLIKRLLQPRVASEPRAAGLASRLPAPAVQQAG